jgi:hypothetical protein
MDSGQRESIYDTGHDDPILNSAPLVFYITPVIHGVLAQAADDLKTFLQSPGAGRVTFGTVTFAAGLYTLVTVASPLVGFFTVSALSGGAVNIGLGIVEAAGAPSGDPKHGILLANCRTCIFLEAGAAIAGGRSTSSAPRLVETAQAIESLLSVGLTGGDILSRASRAKPDLVMGDLLPAIDAGFTTLTMPNIPSLLFDPPDQSSPKSGGDSEESETESEGEPSPGHDHNR